MKYPPIEPHRTGFLDVGSGHSLYWEESGASSRPSRGLSSRRPRVWHGAGAPLLFRSGSLPDHPVRSARLRPEPPPFESARQHHLASRRRHREIARTPRHLSVEVVFWRLLGQHPCPRLRGDPSGLRASPHSPLAFFSAARRSCTGFTNLERTTCFPTRLTAISPPFLKESGPI